MSRPRVLQYPLAVRCPICGRTSHNPNDVREGYCGNCHDWTSLPVLPGNAPGTGPGGSMSESAPDLEQAEGTAEQGSSTESLPAETPVGPEGGAIDETEAIGTPADGPGAELLTEFSAIEVEPRDVTDENPLVEGEVPEGLTRTDIEGDRVPTNVGTPELDEIGQVVDDAVTQHLDEELDPNLPRQADDPTDPNPDPEQDPEDEYEPHELDLPPVPETEQDKPASHAPFDPTEGHR